METLNQILKISFSMRVFEMSLLYLAFSSQQIRRRIESQTIFAAAFKTNRGKQEVVTKQVSRTVPRTFELKKYRIARKLHFQIGLDFIYLIYIFNIPLSLISRRKLCNKF